MCNIHNLYPLSALFLHDFRSQGGYTVTLKYANKIQHFYYEDKHQNKLCPFLRAWHPKYIFHVGS